MCDCEHDDDYDFEVDWPRTVDLLACDVLGHQEKWESFTECGDTRRWSVCKRCGVGITGRPWRGRLQDQMDAVTAVMMRRVAETVFQIEPQPFFTRMSGLRQVVDGVMS